MNTITVQFLGSGDAFGSGGRLQTCILVSGQTQFLMDCGPSCLVAFNRYGINPDQITTIFLTHLHGDHAAGIPFFILDAQFVRKRTTPLTIVGPKYIATWYKQIMELLFPGFSTMVTTFPLTIAELELGKTTTINTIAIEPFAVVHADMTALALRITFQNKVITFSGDTEWTEALIPAAREADFFISECYTYNMDVQNHLNYITLKSHLADIHAKRVILTHMSEELLGRLAEVDCETADDGKVFTIS